MEDFNLPFESSRNFYELHMIATRRNQSWANGTTCESFERKLEEQATTMHAKPNTNEQGDEGH